MTHTHTFATEIVRGPGADDVLRLREARVRVISGPDSGKEALVEEPFFTIGWDESCQLRLTDPTVSRHHLELHATTEGLRLRDLESTNGTTIAGVLIRQAMIVKRAEVTVGTSKLSIEPTERPIDLPISRKGRFGGLVGQSDEMRHLFALLERSAPVDITVLLEGESGTGKELAAHAIHQQSSRKDHPFIVVDCGAIPENLIESELFGHVRGAFTGAQNDRKGAIEQAEGGTLFLDEVGELPLALQPRLLRFLEGHEYKRLGQNSYRRANVRVVAATNRSLAHEVAEKVFREDLYYRLSVVRIRMPSLRERPEDIELLARHRLEQIGLDPDEVLTEDQLKLMRSHTWPGNARELRNVVDRMSVDPSLAISSMANPEPAQDSSAESALLQGLFDQAFHEARKTWQDHFERAYVSELMRRTDRSVVEASKHAGVPRTTFHRLLTRHSLRKP